jgi:hypothetical protein
MTKCSKGAGSPFSFCLSLLAGKTPTPTIPILKEVKAEYAKLQ